MKWINDWPVCGHIRDELEAGTPVDDGEYPIAVITDDHIDTSDLFDKNELSLMWQFPANHKNEWYSIDHGLKLKCVYHDTLSINNIGLTPNILLSKIAYLSFYVETKITLDSKSLYDEAGLCLYGAI